MQTLNFEFSHHLSLFEEFLLEIEKLTQRLKSFMTFQFKERKRTVVYPVAGTILILNINTGTILFVSHSSEL